MLPFRGDLRCIRTITQQAKSNEYAHYLSLVVHRSLTRSPLSMRGMSEQQLKFLKDLVTHVESIETLMGQLLASILRSESETGTDTQFVARRKKALRSVQIAQKSAATYKMQLGAHHEEGRDGKLRKRGLQRAVLRDQKQYKFWLPTGLVMHALEARRQYLWLEWTHSLASAKALVLNQAGVGATGRDGQVSVNTIATCHHHSETAFGRLEERLSSLHEPHRYAG